MGNAVDKDAQLSLLDQWKSLMRPELQSSDEDEDASAASSSSPGVRRVRSTLTLAPRVHPFRTEQANLAIQTLDEADREEQNIKEPRVVSHRQPTSIGDRMKRTRDLQALLEDKVELAWAMDVPRLQALLAVRLSGPGDQQDQQEALPVTTANEDQSLASMDDCGDEDEA
jgi:hypothetical protein